jgi:hypothetical protein
MSGPSQSRDPLRWLIRLVYPSCLHMERRRRLDRHWSRACRRRLRQGRRPTRRTLVRLRLSTERIPMAMVSMKGMQAGMNKVRSSSINLGLRRHLLSNTRIRPLLCPCIPREVDIITRHQDRDTRPMRCRAILTCINRSSTASTLRTPMRITINRQGPCPAPLSWVRRQRVGIPTPADNINRTSSSISRLSRTNRARTARRDRTATLRECSSSVPMARSCLTMLLEWSVVVERP